MENSMNPPNGDVFGQMFTLPNASLYDVTYTQAPSDPGQSIARIKVSRHLTIQKDHTMLFLQTPTGLPLRILRVPDKNLAAVAKELRALAKVLSELKRLSKTRNKETSNAVLSSAGSVSKPE